LVRGGIAPPRAVHRDPVGRVSRIGMSRIDCKRAARTSSLDSALALQSTTR
jgi:hypothetical protein